MVELVSQIGNELVTTSKIVADVFGKVHRNVMRDIEKLDCSDEFRAQNFRKSHYTSPQNKVLKCYEMTEIGVIYLITGFTGARAALKKESLMLMLSDSVAISKAIEIIKGIDIDDSDLFIYVAQESSSGRYKVGISKNPSRRVKELNIGNPEKLILIHESIAADGFKTESIIHKELMAHRISGEWFSSIAPLITLPPKP